MTRLIIDYLVYTQNNLPNSKDVVKEYSEDIVSPDQHLLWMDRYNKMLDKNRDFMMTILDQDLAPFSFDHVVNLCQKLSSLIILVETNPNSATKLLDPIFPSVKSNHRYPHNLFVDKWNRNPQNYIFFTSMFDPCNLNSLIRYL